MPSNDAIAGASLNEQMWRTSTRLELPVEAAITPVQSGWRGTLCE
jgi:hypothetical protein